ncbi:30S ribosomal protein S3 [Candidatus Phytoplasma phoenicium]|uniref:Small ribosomal subunit protein uS3 n=4 Tax=16SrIX (Pigeon pea witches'-broom group) TaxID=85629 RepID=A0A0L0MKG5_9MOLU|nr:30S ribosomal protein S3 [Candidatus Phytoplasma phoenicium]ABN13135.1 ribosomal protein S3 [Almond witches'-broom phytoplasma]ALY05400.1 ribosomal protein S3 ['Smilax aspera' phytoplasma]KND62786.1 30S ribosomal protein S3 [Candidatus Phytoplasma phoenicium]
MGQKSNPNGLRLGIIQNWRSQWYAEDKQVPNLVYEDFKIRTLIKKFYIRGIISEIEIKRLKKSNSEEITINLFTSKIGLVQGADNKEKNKLLQKIEKTINKKILLNVFEVKTIDKIASLVAQNVAMQLQQRSYFRAVQKITTQKVLKSGAKGVKIILSGRLGGAEIARRETISLGLVPLNTFRADIDYAFEEAHTTYGVLGVQVWIFHGEVLPNKTIADTRQFFVQMQEIRKHFVRRYPQKLSKR